MATGNHFGQIGIREHCSGLFGHIAGKQKREGKEGELKLAVKCPPLVGPSRFYDSMWIHKWI